MRRTLGLGLIMGLLVAFVPAVSAQADTASTTTVIEAPNQFGVNAVMPLRIQVTNNAGAAAPTGSIALQDSLGRTITTTALRTTDNGGFSFAIINWATQQTGLQKLRAVYTPNSASFAPSQSTYAGTLVLQATPLAVLRMPDRFVVGTQANLTVLINPANGGGSATFNVNNVQVRPSTPNVNGEIAFPWTPERSTQFTFVINYSNGAGTNSLQVRQPTFAFPN
jgi:hypothetical protein